MAYNNINYKLEKSRNTQIQIQISYFFEIFENNKGYKSHSIRVFKYIMFFLAFCLKKTKESIAVVKELRIEIESQNLSFKL